MTPPHRQGFFDHRVMTTAGAVVVIGALAFGGICPFAQTWWTLAVVGA